MPYIFNTQRNSYFQGQDVRVEDTDTHDVILVNVKDGMWAVNVKDDTVFNTLPPAVRNAISNLPEGIVDGVSERIKEAWWHGANEIGEEHGFSHIYSAGHSSGWAAFDGTQSWEPVELFSLTNDVPDFLAAAFQMAGPHLEDAQKEFNEGVMEAMQELQIELSEYADWVGAEVQGLDGGVGKAVKLELNQGRAALRWDDGMFSFATESKLVRKADGNVPSRLTADPIMEEVFQIIEARGELTKEEIETFLDADDDHDPNTLYVNEIARSVSAIESQIETWSHEHLGVQHG